jgi:hypothetical protein
MSVALKRPGDMAAVTFAWADARAELYGQVRLATGLDGDGAERPSVLALALAGRDTVGAIVNGPGVTATAEEPLARWSVRAEGELELALAFEATTPPAEFGGRHALARAGGVEGYSQLCRVTGTAGGRPVDGLGQRDDVRGNPDWDKIALTRTLGVWQDDGTGMAVQTVRPAKAESHADEAAWGVALDPERIRKIEEPRLSTTTDAAGRPIRAGVELWIEGADEYPFRGTGEVLAGAALDLGALRLDCAFFRWHVEGRTAVGRYDVLRRA